MPRLRPLGSNSTRATSLHILAPLSLLSWALGCNPESKPDTLDEPKRSEPGTNDSAVPGCTAVNWWLDADGDGFGAGDPIEDCVPPDDRYVPNAEDCDDSEPAIHPEALEADPVACQDGLDNNCDRSVDCADPSCTVFCHEDCADGSDNDLDGLVDCEDTDCSSDAACPEDCSNGLDDDADGRTDCEDAECRTNIACQEDCSNGLDDDDDGRTDCEDDDCWGAPSCSPTMVGVTSGHIRYSTRSASSVPFSTSRLLVVDSASGWVSSYQSGSGWKQCGWMVQPWSTAFLVSSVGGTIFSPSRGSVSFTGSCSASESDLPPQFRVDGSRGLPIYGYGFSTSNIWYTGRTTATWTTGSYTTALWRGVDLSPSDTWVGP